MEFNKNVIYFENEDFDKNGNIKNSIISNDDKVMIMVGANFCGFCSQTKPEFEKAADKLKGKVICGVILLDGELDSEKKLGKRIKDIIPNFRGVPEIVLYKNKKFIKKYKGNRQYQSFIEFCLS